MPSFEHVQAEDKVIRRMGQWDCSGGKYIYIRLKVSEVDANFIYCGPPREGWKFRRDNGAEVDEYLGWGVPLPDGSLSPTGSCLVPDVGQKCVNDGG